MIPRPIFKLVSPIGQIQTRTWPGILPLILSIVMLSLVAQTIWVQPVRANDPEPGEQLSLEALRNVDPADRKFFNPGYEDLSNGSARNERLLSTDPADRKFFNPGYGVNVLSPDLLAYRQSEWSRTPNTDMSISDLRQIDPADRKFFNPGYGMQTATLSEVERLPTAGVEPRPLSWPLRPTQFHTGDKP